MAITTDDYYDEVCWERYFGVCPAGVVVVSQSCFGDRWCLGGFFGGVSVVS